MLDDVSGGIGRYAKEVRPIIAGVRIPPHVLRKGMKCRTGKPFLIDIGQTAHRATISHAQQVEISRVVSKSRENRNCIQARAVMMNLSFRGSARRCAVEKIPEAASIAVITPARN